MNYIKQLELEKLQLQGQVANIKQEIHDFLVFLQTSPKFQGLDQGNERKDWISTTDVINRLQEIRNIN